MRVIAIADLHVGSHWGLADPSVTGAFTKGKQVQERLFEKWKEATQGEWSNPDVLVINGDAIDGQGRKDGGSLQWTANIEDQINHCVDLVKMWKAKKIYVIWGSKYHVGVGRDTGLCAEELLARKLNAEEYPNQEHLPEEYRQRSGLHWFLTFEDTTVHFSHHVAFSRVFAYMSTPIAREMMSARLNDPMRHGLELLYQNKNVSFRDVMQEMEHLTMYKTRIIVRGHVHYFWANDSGGSLGIVLPAWQLPTPYMIERNPLGFSHVGFVGFDFQPEGKFTWYKKLIRIEDAQKPPHTIVN